MRNQNAQAAQVDLPLAQHRENAREAPPGPRDGDPVLRRGLGEAELGGAEAEEARVIRQVQAPFVDLGEMLREQFYLALPMQPLCRPDCQGLCPVCGVDRNLERCECQTEWVDPRLSGLKALVNRKPD